MLYLSHEVPEDIFSKNGKYGRKQKERIGVHYFSEHFCFPANSVDEYQRKPHRYQGDHLSYPEEISKEHHGPCWKVLYLNLSEQEGIGEGSWRAFSAIHFYL